MDNILQIEEIRKFRQHLARATGKEIDVETAARIWVMKYARLWRSHHNSLRRKAKRALINS